MSIYPVSNNSTPSDPNFSYTPTLEVPNQENSPNSSYFIGAPDKSSPSFKSLNIMNINFRFEEGKPTPDDLERLKSYVKDIRIGKESFNSQKYFNLLVPIFGKQGINPSLTSIASITRFLRGAGKDIKLSIEAHTDSVGEAEANKKLSQRQADAVKLLFELNGISDQRLTAIGYGEERPLVPETGNVKEVASARHLNNRIVIQIQPNS